MTDDLMRLADLLEDYTAPAWEEFPDIPGFRVEIRVPDAVAGLVAVTKMQGQATEEERARVQVMANLSQAVAAWEGLTVGGLKRLLPPRAVKFTGDEATPVPYTAEIRDALIRLSERFVVWLAMVIHRRREAAEAREEELEKNS